MSDVIPTAAPTLPDGPGAFPGDLFTAELVDLGAQEDPRFAGVLTPRPEIGAARPGATATFLDNAEAYYERHQDFDDWMHPLRAALDRAGVRDAGTIVEYGCGFGNATLPLLQLFPQAKVVASDISPNLLAILHRLLVARGERERCVPVALDAHKPYLLDGVADLVMGSAILHHLAEPGLLVQAAMRVLKPGGWAVFFEPMEAGYAMLRLVIRDLCQDAAVREFQSPALTWLAEISVEWTLQIKRDGLPGWRDLDDKWLFPRSTLERFADEAGAELVVMPMGGRGSPEPFRSMLRYILKGWRGLDPDDAAMMPAWAWDIVRRYDQDYFSEDFRTDLLMEATVLFRKR
ncbi:class I SAM-dependent methyltransferase [Roseomonas sp. CCTCC AB2023176]|uniref:class I SAM-dependent methyltransferase n=1 Tax=Roseomonas sp. CCTCC AB2023176 TaxID=3342640 RepID=UPI0035DAD7B6